MSDLFFIISSVCVVVLTILLSIVLVKAMTTLDETNTILAQTRNVTQTVERTVMKVASFGSIISPVMGIANLFLKNKRKKVR